jgi:DNA polymerase-3 subunit beta
MQFTCTQADIVVALAMIQGIGKNAKTLLRVTEHEIEVVSTDSEITMAVKCAATVGLDSSSIMVDARHFFQVVKSLPSGTVDVKQEDNYRMVIDCGPAHFKTFGLDPKDFPALPPFVARSTMVVKGLVHLIDQVYFCIPAEDNRYGINGCHFEAEDGHLRLVSTDGSRMAYSEAEFQGDFKIPPKTLVSRKTLQEVKRMVGSDEVPASISFGKSNMILVKTDRAQLHARLVDGEFPPYRRVLPQSHLRRVEVDRVALVEALKRVALEARDKSSTIKVQFTREELLASSRSVEYGEASHPVPVVMTGEDATMGLNAAFLLDALNAFDDGVATMELGEALGPCVIRPKDKTECLFIVMPIRLD